MGTHLFGSPCIFAHLQKTLPWVGVMRDTIPQSF